MRRLSLAATVVAAIAVSYGLGSYRQQSRAGVDFGTVHAKETGPAPVAPSAAVPTPGVRLEGASLAAVERAGVSDTVRAVGRVVPEDTRVYRIDASIDGLIRNTYNDSVGTLVKKDQRLATFYAPEFLAASNGYLAAVQGVKGSVAKDGARFTPEFPGALAKEGPRSMQGYRDRLRNFGMSLRQIQQIADTHELPDVIDILAPADGVILSREITPGQHVAHHGEFYRMADLSKVWVIAEVDEQSARFLHPGATAHVTVAGGGHTLAARVTDSLRQSEAGGRTVKLRLEVDNPALQLRPDILVDVALPVRMPPAVTVPVDALVDSGAQARVYVASAEGTATPREVATGWRFGGRVEILKGLRPGERVVAGAAFLLDSESRLNAAQLR